MLKYQVKKTEHKDGVISEIVEDEILPVAFVSQQMLIERYKDPNFRLVAIEGGNSEQEKFAAMLAIGFLQEPFSDKENSEENEGE